MSFNVFKSPAQHHLTLVLIYSRISRELLSRKSFRRFTRFIFPPYHGTPPSYSRRICGVRRTHRTDRIIRQTRPRGGLKLSPCIGYPSCGKFPSVMERKLCIPGLDGGTACWTPQETTCALVIPSPVYTHSAPKIHSLTTAGRLKPHPIVTRMVSPDRRRRLVALVPDEILYG